MVDRLEIEVDERTYRGQRTPLIGFGRQPVRHGGGGRETWPVVRFVEGHITFDEPVAVEMLEAIDDAAVRVHRFNGFSMRLDDVRKEYAAPMPGGMIGLKMMSECRTR